MKNLTLISLLLLTSCMVTQLPTEQTTLEKVIEVPGVSQNDLYVRANTWFVRTFNSAESVIEFQDKESGKIAGKYIVGYNYLLTEYLGKQTITVDVKEGKARIRIENPMVRQRTGMGAKYSPVNKAHLDKLKPKWNELIADFEKGVNTSDDF